MHGLKVAALSVTTLLLSAAVWISWVVSQPVETKRRFDKAEWLEKASLANGIGDPGCVRGGMALDLIDQRMLVGMRALEVAALLGTPSRQDNAWRYALGQCSGLGWHDSELLVRFDSSDHVTAVVFEQVRGYAP